MCELFRYYCCCCFVFVAITRRRRTEKNPHALVPVRDSILRPHGDHENIFIEDVYLVNMLRNVRNRIPERRVETFLGRPGSGHG